MQKLCIVADTPGKAAAIERRVEGLFDPYCLEVDRIGKAVPPPFLVFDVDFTRGDRAVRVKEWLSRKPKEAKVIFAVDRASHLQIIQATALGATGILHRPFDGAALIRQLLGGSDLMASADPDGAMKASPGVAEAVQSLRDIFESACLGTPVDLAAVNSTGEAIIRRMESQGLPSWLATVRQHHSQTYQHCLIVTGVTVAFAQNLGLSRSDQLRLSLAAMLHDIGKARIPLAILEKPSALTADEKATMCKHPEYGLAALECSPGLDRGLREIVLNHHEYLDGSGYPHGLRGQDISDSVRIVTICDVFGALLERRAYKPPLAGHIAYQTLLDMGQKLDTDLVREFGFTRTLRLDTAA